MMKYDYKPPPYTDSMELESYRAGYRAGFRGRDPNKKTLWPNAYSRGYNEGAFDAKHPTQVHSEGQDDGY